MTLAALDDLDFDALDVVLKEEENYNINLQGKTVADVLGLTQEKSSPELQALKHYEVDIDMYDDIYQSSTVMQASVEEGMQEIAVFDSLNTDMFLSLFKYKPEIIAESRMRQSTRINNRIMRKLVETDEYRSLRKNCRLDLFNSALGTEIIGEKAVEIIRNWKQEAIDKYNQRQQQKANGQPGGPGQPGSGGSGGVGGGGGQQNPQDIANPFELIEQLKKKEQELDDLLEQQQSVQEILDQMKNMGGGGGGGSSQFQQAAGQIQMDLDTAQQVAQAISDQLDDFLDENDDLMEDLNQRLMGAFSEADNQVAETVDFLDAWGLNGDDNGACRVPFAEKREAVERIRDTKKLKDLTDLIGRFKDTAVHDQKKRSKDGATSVKSIQTGNKIETVLPSEKMKLCNEITKGDFYRRFNQKELLQYERQSHTTKSKGPIITCIDTSGSMEGSREKWSKAIAIAMLEVAHIQKRDYAAIIFSSTADAPIVIAKDAIEPTKLLDIAEKFHDQGTTFEDPLNKALELIKESRFSKADIVFITDGESSVSPTFLKKFNQIKEDKEFGVKSICINVGHGSRVSTKALESFSDEVIMLSNIADLEDADSDVAHNIFSSI